MEKRGQSEVLEITLLFEFMAGILIAGILIYTVIEINETSTMTEEYLNKDYGIVKGILEGKQGEYKITYPSGMFYVKDNQFVKPGGIQLKADNMAKITKESGEIKIEMIKK